MTFRRWERLRRFRWLQQESRVPALAAAPAAEIGRSWRRNARWRPSGYRYAATHRHLNGAVEHLRVLVEGGRRASGGRAQVDLVGHSLGGAVIMEYLARHGGAGIGHVVTLDAPVNGISWGHAGFWTDVERRCLLHALCRPALAGEDVQRLIRGLHSDAFDDLRVFGSDPAVAAGRRSLVETLANAGTRVTTFSNVRDPVVIPELSAIAERDHRFALGEDLREPPFGVVDLATNAERNHGLILRVEEHEPLRAAFVRALEIPLVTRRGVFVEGDTQVMLTHLRDVRHQGGLPEVEVVLQNRSGAAWYVVRVAPTGDLAAGTSSGASIPKWLALPPCEASVDGVMRCREVSLGRLALAPGSGLVLFADRLGTTADARARLTLIRGADTLWRMSAGTQLPAGAAQSIINELDGVRDLEAREEEIIASTPFLAGISTLGAADQGGDLATVAGAVRAALADPSLQAWLHERGASSDAAALPRATGTTLRAETVIAAQVRSLVENWIPRGAPYGTIRVVSHDGSV